MEHRNRGVATTLSAVVIFGTLVSANVIVLRGFQVQFELTAKAFEENSIVSEANLQLGAVSFSVLSNLQHSLEVSSFSCSDALPLISSLALRSSSDTPVAGVFLHVEGRGRYALQGPKSDNLTMLRPFSGFVPENLNFEVVLTASARGGDLAYLKTEHHFFHLPLLLDRSISLCHSASAYLISQLNSLLRKGAECTGSRVKEVVENANLLYGDSWSEGLRAFFSARTISEAECAGIFYSVVILQPNIPGAEGDFTWRMAEAGSLFP